MKKQLFKIALLFTALMIYGCTSTDEEPGMEISKSKSTKMGLVKIDINKNLLYKKSSNKNNDFVNRVAILNEALLEHGIQIEKMEFLGAEGAGNEVYFKNVGNKQTGSENVVNDPRNWFNETNAPFYGNDNWTDGTIPYWTDGSEQGTPSGINDNGPYDGMTSQETLTAIYSAMDTWGSVNCSNGLDIWNVYTTTPGFDDGVSNLGDVGFVQFLEGLGGYPGYAPGSILHGGNLPAAFFEQVTGRTNILGICFTFTWVVDINQNGKPDVAIKEIYINRDFNWQDAPDDVQDNGIIDYETVVLHEAGHGLNQAHFGKAFITNKNGKEHSAPFALMNPSYSIGLREITATDNAGHCSMWGEWPNN